MKHHKFGTKSLKLHEIRFILDIYVSCSKASLEKIPWIKFGTEVCVHASRNTVLCNEKIFANFDLSFLSFLNIYACIDKLFTPTLKSKHVLI